MQILGKLTQLLHNVLHFNPLSLPFTTTTNPSQIQLQTPHIKTHCFFTIKTQLPSHSYPSHNSEHLSVTQAKLRWENTLSTAASLYPLYVTVGGIVACFKPSAFAWFVERGPSSYSFSLGLIMLAMGLTLELKNLLNLFTQRNLSILFGCVAQYTIMPIFAMVISKTLGLSQSLSVGLILLGCCPGDAASTVVTFIARGDVLLSTVMMVCTTLGAVILTPLLTMVRAGTYVPVDAIGLSISTLQA
ncbi:hypothetical protein J1N35_042308 [Gossypium stocksii]|uniref:Uncharacterized protein n=1 Tax=Gossypium stocksii TaxID=47602 RepID=A0A9D3UHD6_9ROSI|nr:hypothetical protein J1N35_042308 [Gossypium stocksii]